MRNIRQTETLVDLRHAILQVARHFQALDPHNTPLVCLCGCVCGNGTFLYIFFALFECRYENIYNVFSPTHPITPPTHLQNLQADYKQDSHSFDLQRYISVNPHKFKRAKALLDFERHDDDELGFKKNDVITVGVFFVWVSSFGSHVIWIEDAAEAHTHKHTHTYRF